MTILAHQDPSSFLGSMQLNSKKILAGASEAARKPIIGAGELMTTWGMQLTTIIARVFALDKSAMQVAKG